MPYLTSSFCQYSFGLVESCETLTLVDEDAQSKTIDLKFSAIDSQAGLETYA